MSLLIVYHTRTGGTEQMARAAYDGARGEIATSLKHAEEADPEDLLTATGYIFAAPENLASLSGEMKAFFDRCYYPVLGKIEGRPYGLMICAGSDGQGAVRQTQRICKGWRLKLAQDPIIICTHAQTQAEILAQKTLSKSDIQTCHDLGKAIGAGIAMGVF